MYQSVRDAFLKVSEPWEGRVYHMYLDKKGLLTTAVGNLIDSPQQALKLPWKNVDGSLATKADVIACWYAVKSRQDMRLQGGGAYAKISSLRLSHEDVDRIVYAKLDSVDTHLTERFVDAYTTAPADAQLGLLSMSWAMGEWFHFPKFEAALRVRDYCTCANECLIHPNEGTIILRNAANKKMFETAQRVEDEGSDLETLHYPE